MRCETVKKHIEVVAAVIISEQQVLCAQRSDMMSLPLLWEFPGGKIDPGESERTALKREIKEELLCDIMVGDKITTTTYDYDFSVVHLHSYQCTLQTQAPTLTEHKTIKWLNISELQQLAWAPADIPTVDIISRSY